jgi:hypothetical protein
MVTFVIQVLSPKVYEPMVCVGHNRNFENILNNKSRCLGVQMFPWLANDLLTTLLSYVEKLFNLCI